MITIKLAVYFIIYVMAGLPFYLGNSLFSCSRYPSALKWEEVMYGFHGTDFAVSNAGKICVVGCYDMAEIDIISGNSPRSYSYDIHYSVITTNSAGGISNDIGFDLKGLGNDEALGVDIDDIGNIYITGYFSGEIDFAQNPKGNTRKPIGHQDAFVLKLDKNMTYKWVDTFGGVGGEAKGYDIAVDKTGGVIIVGSFQGPMDFDPGPSEDVKVSLKNPDPMVSYSDGFVIKVDSEGNYCWGIAIGSVGLENVLKVGVNSNNDIVVAGNFTCGNDDTLSILGDKIVGKFQVRTNGNDDIFLAMIDNIGVPYWLKNYGGTADDCIFGLALDNDGGIIFTGFASDNNNTFLTYYDHYGNQQWTIAWGESFSAIARSCSITTDDIIYVLGSFEGAVDLDPGPREEIFSSHGRWNDNALFISRFDINSHFKGAWILKRDAIGVNIIAKDINSVYAMGQSHVGSRIDFNTFLAKFGE